MNEKTLAIYKQDVKSSITNTNSNWIQSITIIINLML